MAFDKLIVEGVFRRSKRSYDLRPGNKESDNDLATRQSPDISIQQIYATFIQLGVLYFPDSIAFLNCISRRISLPNYIRPVNLILC